MNSQGKEKDQSMYFELSIPSKASAWHDEDLKAALLIPSQKESELSKQETQQPDKGLLSKFKIQKDEDKIDQRIVYLDGKVYPPNTFPNYIRNQKFTILSFIPIVLYEQFKFFFNLFFLFITLSQFIPVLKVGFLFSYLAPLLFVLILTMLKEAYDDIQRYKRDKEANSQQYTLITRDRSDPVPSSVLKVGDICEIHANQRIPADCILLSCSDPTGSVFIRTDQLDGETDWKLRKAIRYTQNYAKNKNLTTLNASITAEEPKLDIYDFKGLFKLEVGGGEGQRESLSLENTLWCNTYLAAGKVQALVIYSGKQCRSSMNSREPRSKQGQIDCELNYLSKVLFLIMVGIAFLLIACKGFVDSWLLEFFRHILLLSSIIPISLRVNLDFAKMYFSMGINHDKDIEGAIARNSTIPEELGRISYILTDKTGTLTQNTMIFKKISLERIQYTEQNTKLLKKIVLKQCQTQNYPMHDVIERSIQNQGKRQKNMKRSKELVTRDMITALGLCHNVTPTFEDNGTRTFQASSPDEIALVQISEEVGMKLISRDTQKLVLQNAGGVNETYNILYEFPFTSDRKRMGIILRIPDQKGVLFYLKGADTIMKSKVPEVQRGFLMDECEMLSREGLRTLVITQKYISEQEYVAWQKQYEDAKNSLENREQKCNKVLDSLELDMELLGITGVEDMLQEDIQHTIESLRNAGIQIWMLTGDKVETAQCIAISTGLKPPNQDMYTIKDIEDSLILQNELNQFALYANCVLVIDGQSLKVALEEQKLIFLQVACKAPAVVCCRCSPTQKALVTEAIKEFTNKTVLSIGDGGNDVAMIQAADVGVGIVGKEGKQAALASDFSILKFKHVATLLLWHGRLAYKRSSVMAQFVMHRGLVISIIQMIFSLLFNFVAMPVYNGWLMLGYATVYTMLPVFCLIFDEDVTKDKAMEYTELYKALLKGRQLTDKTFFIWLWKSVYQGTVIMVLAFSFFDKNSFIDIVTVSFTSLIIVELLNVYSELHRLKIVTVLAESVTLAMYICSLIFLRGYLNTGDISEYFIIQVIFIVLISWLPIHSARFLLRTYSPSESDKIMKKIKIRT